MENNDPNKMVSRKNVLPAFLGILIGAGILLAVMMLLQPNATIPIDNPPITLRMPLNSALKR